MADEARQEPGSTQNPLAWRISAMLPLLNERQRRLYLGAEAIAAERVSVAEISGISGISRNTISAGMKEIRDILENGGDYDAIQGVRKSGAGRKKIRDDFPNLHRELKEALRPGGLDTPQFQWCSWSLGTIQEKLKERGIWVGRTTVSNALTEGGFFHHPSKGDAMELDSAVRNAVDQGIPLIELEIVGNPGKKLPERVWNFIRAWWNTDQVVVITSLPASVSADPGPGILRISHPAGYIHWKFRRMSALLRIRDEEDHELRCLFWQLTK